jgi:hypothetical protein
MVRKKGTKVKIKAPFMDMPVGNNKKLMPILMDRHFMDNLMEYIQKKELKMIHCAVVKHHVVLEFVDKFEATKFALGYTEIYAKAEPKIF